MDLDRLRVFLRVAELGTMRAAAVAVHRTQPAVSRSIAVLEEEIGAALFLREGRGLILTAAGRALVPHARSLLERVEEAAREVGRVAERDYFNLRLGSIDSVATFLMPDALASLRKRLPRLIVRLNTGRTALLLDRVRRDQLDLAVVAYSGAPPGVRATRIGPYALRFYGRRDRFADLAEVDSREGLQRFPVVEIEPPPGDPGAEPAARASYAAASNVATVKALILAGFGVGDLVPFML
jgi:DNA-binding transcriptional LysR family regulator